MCISYEKLYKLMNRKGESFNSLKEKGVISDYASRSIANGEPVNVKHIAKICRHFNVPIEEVIEVKQD